MKSFYKLYELVGHLSYKLFPKAGSVEHMKKLKQEADEVIQKPSDIEEYADCLFALLAGANKEGFEAIELLSATYNKALINDEREWQEKPDGTHQHKR